VEVNLQGKCGDPWNQIDFFGVPQCCATIEVRLYSASTHRMRLAFGTAVATHQIQNQRK